MPQRHRALPAASRSGPESRPAIGASLHYHPRHGPVPRQRPLIQEGRIGCVPGVDFGSRGEGYVRFCFARERRELEGALASMGALFAATT
jgi:hypothetical protein